MPKCDINDAGKQLILDPKEAIDIVGGDNIKVDKQSVDNKLIYTINYQEYSAPAIEVNTAIHKVGTTVPSFTFNGVINKGSENIISRDMVPDKGLDLTQPFSWTETSITGTDAGLWPKFNGEPLVISAMDSKGTSISKQVGLDFRYLFYMGYSIESTITEALIKAFSDKTLLTNIRNRFGTFTYNYTIVPTYIYWVFPLSSPSFSEASEGPLPVPLKLDHPNVVITDEGISRTYRVIRTAVRTRFNNATIRLI